MQVTETNTSGLKREYKVVVPAGDLKSKVDGKLVARLCRGLKRRRAFRLRLFNSPLPIRRRDRPGNGQCTVARHGDGVRIIYAAKLQLATFRPATRDLLSHHLFFSQRDGLRLLHSITI